MVVADGPEIARRRAKMRTEDGKKMTRRRFVLRAIALGHGEDVLTEAQLYRIESERTKNTFIATIGAIADVFDCAIDRVTKRVEPNLAA
jgi:hypothetical protein